jgi:hemolysin III
MLAHAGVTATALVAGGGFFYTLGAVVYAVRRPNLLPRVFGYHELFHVLVVAAVALQYAAVSLVVG